MTNSSIEIGRSNLLILKNVYKLNRFKSEIGYLTLNNYVQWLEQDQHVKHIRIYCLNGDFSDGTFVLTDRNRAYTDTLSNSFDRLSQLLQLINYSKGLLFLGIRPEIRQVLKVTLQKANIEIMSDNKAILYHLSRDDAMTFKVQSPQGIHLRSMTQSRDMEKASQMWIHQDTCSFPYVRRLAKYNPNVAAFNDDGQMVAWIFRLPIGLLGGLKTDEKHCGHGYGSLVTKELSKKIAEIGDDVYAAIYPDNLPSHSLFKKLGFQPVGDTFFISTKITWSLFDE